jgi:ABC-type sugar transport system substrate-binding protein
VTRRSFFVGAIVALVLAGCSSSTPTGGTKTTIAVIPKGTSHVFWQSIHAGAAKAAQELGVDIIWRGPLREDDRASQIAEVEGFITRGVSGIVLRRSTRRRWLVRLVMPRARRFQWSSSTQG